MADDLLEGSATAGTASNTEFNLHTRAASHSLIALDPI